uniref:Headcase N-terminal domain-containing protein n=1 Tax=Panagrolaimus davidi TaxID=227884 RepID=A0A914PUT4_9BILA
MREKKFVKEQLKQVKKQKKEIDAKVKEEDGIAHDRNGEIKCCIPFLQCTRIGHPLPETMADGVKMCCTNPECAYAKHLVHYQCFRSLEQNLMTLMSVKGYDKSVTENVRINNERLWIKKGLALVQKNLKCACGKGQMTRDNDAWDEREKQYGPPVEEKEKKHKTKTAKLPSITTTVKNRAPPQHDAKKLRKLEGHFLSSHSPPEESNFEKKYCPLPPAKKPAAAIPTYPSFGTAKQSTNFSKFAPAKQSKPSAPKYPIGFAPVERPKPVQEIEEESETTEEISTYEEEQSSNFNNGTKMQQQPKANETLFPHYHFSYNPNPNLKNALVQTDETDFPAAILKEPGLRMYSSKDSFDSGLGSLPSRYWKDSQSNFDQFNSGLNSRRSSLSHGGISTNNIDADFLLSPPSEQEQHYEEYTKISFIFLYDGKFGIEIDKNGQKRMLKNIFDNDWTPLYLSMAESGIEIGETAQFHHCDYPKHVIYDILKVIGKPFNEINMDPNIL